MEEDTYGQNLISMNWSQAKSISRLAMFVKILKAFPSSNQTKMTIILSIIFFETKGAHAL